MTTLTDPSGVAGPYEFVIGSANLESTAAFLSVFGLQAEVAPKPSASASRVLYGLDSPTDHWIMKAPDLPTSVRLVKTPYRSRPIRAFDCGSRGIDFYAADVSMTARVAAAAGGSDVVSTAYAIDRGPSHAGARIVSPGQDFEVWAIAKDPRFPSILDTQPGRPHSQIVVTSWVIPYRELEPEVDFWASAFGLTRVAARQIVRSDEIDRLMEHPHRTEMGVIQFADDTTRCRLELLYYPHEVTPETTSSPLKTGLHSIVFSASQVGRWNDRLPSATILGCVEVNFGHGNRLITAGVSPGGIRFELSETRP